MACGRGGGPTGDHEMPDRQPLRSIHLRDGRLIATVGDALHLISELSEAQQRGRDCDLAVHALDVARRRYATFIDVEEAQRQLITALRAERLL